MNKQQDQISNDLSNVTEHESKPKYEAPEIKVLTEQQVLSAFQVTAAGTMMWWG